MAPALPPVSASVAFVTAVGKTAGTLHRSPVASGMMAFSGTRRARNALMVSYLGVGVLLFLAALGTSAVMAVSAVGTGLGLWITRNDPLRTRLVAVVIGALGGSLFAETIHTAYHLLGGETASGDSGFFYVSAVLVEGINAAAMLVVTGPAYLLFPPRATVMHRHAEPDETPRRSPPSSGRQDEFI